MSSCLRKQPLVSHDMPQVAHERQKEPTPLEPGQQSHRGYDTQVSNWAMPAILHSSVSTWPSPYLYSCFRFSLTPCSMLSMGSSFRQTQAWKAKPLPGHFWMGGTMMPAMLGVRSKYCRARSGLSLRAMPESARMTCVA